MLTSYERTNVMMMMKKNLYLSFIRQKQIFIKLICYSIANIISHIHISYSDLASAACVLLAVDVAIFIIKFSLGDIFLINFSSSTSSSLHMWKECLSSGTHLHLLLLTVFQCSKQLEWLGCDCKLRLLKLNQVGKKHYFVTSIIYEISSLETFLQLPHQHRILLSLCWS